MAKEALIEIKKGQVGRGLLIENDGFISLDHPNNKKLRENIEEFKRDLVELPRPFVVSAVFQKYGIENGNGRVYPEHVLKRAVEQYQKAIQERRSVGNSDHPDSNTISVKDVSMLITELHWEGHTLVGKIELPITEGFRKYGIVSGPADNIAQLLINNITIGVSSRAIGSVENKYGTLVVGDDFELTCWDYVTTPSTPNAYIRQNEEELRPFIENKKGDENKTVLKEESGGKYDKFLLWLNKKVEK